MKVKKYLFLKSRQVCLTYIHVYLVVVTRPFLQTRRATRACS